MDSKGIYAGTLTREVRIATDGSYIDVNLTGATNADGTLKTEASVKILSNIYSITLLSVPALGLGNNVDHGILGLAVQGLQQLDVAGGAAGIVVSQGDAGGGLSLGQRLDLVDDDVGDPVGLVKILSNIYSITQDTKLSSSNGYFNEAEVLQYSNVNWSEVQAGDRVIWVGGGAGKDVSKASFIVDLAVLVKHRVFDVPSSDDSVLLLLVDGSPQRPVGELTVRVALV